MRFLYPVLFLYFMMLSLTPLVWATTSPVTVKPARAFASLVTSVPSTTSSAGRVTAAPAAPVSFSTSRTSPTATLYCLPPVLTMAYTNCSSADGDRPHAQREATGGRAGDRTTLQARPTVLKRAARPPASRPGGWPPDG